MTLAPTAHIFGMYSIGKKIFLTDKKYRINEFSGFKGRFLKCYFYSSRSIVARVLILLSFSSCHSCIFSSHLSIYSFFIPFYFRFLFRKLYLVLVNTALFVVVDNGNDCSRSVSNTCGCLRNR